MDSLLIDVLGWIGFGLILVGYFLNARKSIYCFYIWGMGNILYFTYGYFIHAIPMMAMSVFVLGMNIYGFVSWKDNS